MNKAPGGIAAEQRSLRPSENFGSFNVEHLTGKRRLVAEINLIDVDSDRAFIKPSDVAVTTHASDAEIAAGPSRQRHREVRYWVCDGGAILNAMGSESRHLKGYERSTTDLET